MQPLPAVTSPASQSVKKFPLRVVTAASPVRPGVAAVIAIDAIGFFVYFVSWSQWIAWTIALMNAGALYFLWRAHHVTRHSSLEVDSKGFELNCATIRVHVPRSNVRSVEPATWQSAPERAPDYLDFARPDVAPNVVITLHRPLNVRLARGIHRAVTRIGIRVDEPEAAIAALSWA